MPTHLCMVYGRFDTTVAKLSRCDRDHVARKVKIFIWPFSEKVGQPLNMQERPHPAGVIRGNHLKELAFGLGLEEYAEF